MPDQDVLLALFAHGVRLTAAESWPDTKPCIAFRAGLMGKIGMLFGLAASTLLFIATASASTTDVLVVPDVDTFRNTVGGFPSNSNIYLQSYFSGFSSGGGMLIFNSADTTSADNGCTIFVDKAGNRFYREFEGPLPILQCGATGSSNTTTGTISSGSTALTLNMKKDFANGEGISIIGAGHAFSLSAPTSLTVSAQGTTGSTQYCYRISSIDGALGIGGAITQVCISNGNAILGSPNDLNAAAHFNHLAWTAPAGTAPSSYAIYGRVNGSLTCIAVTVQTAFDDYGHTQSCPSWIPASPLPPPVSQSDALITTIVSGGGSKNLVLKDSSGTGVSSGAVLHDDTLAFVNALALGNPISVPCGTYSLTSALGISSSGQWINGAGQGCTSLQGHGTFDLITFSGGGSNGGLQKITLDASDMASGFAENISSYDQVHDWLISATSPYNFLYVSNSSSSTFDHVHSDGEVRGQNGIYLVGATGQTTSLAKFTDVQVGGSWTDSCFLADGTVTSIFGFPIICQSSPHEFTVQNTVAVGAFGPNFYSLYGLALNNCWNVCLDLEAGATFHFEKLYAQGSGGAAGPVVYLGNAAKDIKFIGGSVFGSASNGIEDHAFATTVSNTYVYANASDGIYCAPDARGLIVNGGNDYAISAGAQTTNQLYGVELAAGCSQATVSGLWIGTQGGVIDETGVAGNVVIAGLSPGSVTTAVTNTSGTVLSAAVLADGTAGATSVIYRSGPTANFTDTTDTAAHIISAIPNAVPGTTFRIRLQNLTSKIETLAGGTGVTISGTIAAGATRDLVGTETSASAVTIN